MENNKFVGGTVIKGRDLKDQILCKVLLRNMSVNQAYAFQYHVGLNEDTFPLNTKNSECGHGLHFVCMEGLKEIMSDGTLLAFVEVPDDEDVFVIKRSLHFEFRTHRLIVKSVMDLSSASTWDYLFSLGYSVSGWYSGEAMYLAGRGYLDAFRIIWEKVTYVSQHVNEMLREASMWGNLNIIKFLVESSARITWGLDDALPWAAKNGHLETVEFLVSIGAKVTCHGNKAIQEAAANGHLEIVKFLCDNGADVSAHKNAAIRSAAMNNHLPVVIFLQKQGADIGACAVDWVYEYVRDKSRRDKNSSYKVMHNYLYYMTKLGPCECIERMARACAS